MKDKLKCLKSNPYGELIFEGGNIPLIYKEYYEDMLNKTSRIMFTYRYDEENNINRVQVEKEGNGNLTFEEREDVKKILYAKGYTLLSPSFASKELFYIKGEDKNIEEVQARYIQSMKEIQEVDVAPNVRHIYFSNGIALAIHWNKGVLFIVDKIEPFRIDTDREGNVILYKTPISPTERKRIERYIEREYSYDKFVKIDDCYINKYTQNEQRYER